MAGVFTEGLPPPTRSGGRPTDRVVTAERGIRQRLTQPDAVGEETGKNKTDPGPAIGEREYRKVPSGTALAIKRKIDLFVEPSIEFFTRARRLDDLEVG
ncbi:hypothetical protein VST63_21415 [Mycolicibacterium sp. 050232]|uniref:hypothetical protein n=1 Tax=Mycolicibacterium sp. 050232 TaxID=3113982 RepID=UPI002E286A24|nr:hypothetical protein [Mycolicibacterium sp. 050232]MED5814926.1 hypothetical protein [Mycolicibacterium sp. 050232]